MAAAAGFRIAKTSRVTEEKLAQFLAAPVDDDLTSVPGIGAKTAGMLADKGVHTTTQLIGVFLTFKHPGFTVQQHCDAFFNFLREAGLTGYAGGVTLCIAEKANKMIPGIFNAEEVQFE